MTRRILVADDDHLMVRTLCDVLEPQGWEVLMAHGGNEAVEVAAGSPPDAALLDASMDDMHGIEVLARIRVARPGATGILMSGHGPDRLLEEAEALGFLRVLSDGVARDALAERPAAEGPRLVVGPDEALRRMAAGLAGTATWARDVADALGLLERGDREVVMLAEGFSPTGLVALVLAALPTPTCLLGVAGARTDRDGRPPGWGRSRLLPKPFAPPTLLKLLDELHSG